ncbi:hypothetical protein PoHVEF18_000791 [Penicillium ochrochloron]
MVDTIQNDCGLVETAPRPIRKKFAKPPVKCVAKGRKCSYLPSKRGGPRKKKQKASPSPEEEAPHEDAQYAVDPSADFDEQCDLELSSTDPGQALSSARPSVNRERLHPMTPEDLETLLALLILSVYEYSQRGNLLKMRYRAGQALALALDKSLHSCMDNDEFSEARRRAWWMTFTTPYPRFESDAEGWSILIQAQQVLVSATQFISDLNKSLTSQTGLHYIFERMQQLDSWTNSVIVQTDMLPLVSPEPDFGDRRETITAQSIRAISLIKLSSNLDHFQRASSTEYMTPSDSSTSSDIHPYIPQYPQYPFASGFPYSPQHSAKICLRSALTISRMFEALPYPQPLCEGGSQAQHQSGGQPLPRTMPSFACCLMQSSYAMFMIFYKARVAKQLSPDVESELVSNSTEQLVEELRRGLERIIAAVSNYSFAFEALDGMRDEIQGAYQTAFPTASV